MTRPPSGAVDPAAPARPRVFVATTAHQGADARIVFRQIAALLDADFTIEYVAPLPQELHHPHLNHTLVTRARGRRRIRGWIQVYRQLRRHHGNLDLVLVHDLELVLPVRLARPKVPIVWDVHEDVASSVPDRQWIPRLARKPARLVVSALEQFARRNIKLLLAEDSYAERLGNWPVVPNTTAVPTQVTATKKIPNRVVYLGRLSVGRGIQTIIQTAEILGNEAKIVLIGPADDDVAELLRDATSRGTLDWRGPLPNPQALEIVDQAVVGLCLLQALPNYIGSMPTKVYEYFARSIPVITTPLPLAQQAINSTQGGVVVPYDDAEQTANAIRDYLAHPDQAQEAGNRGHQWVQTHHNWEIDGPLFAAQIGDWCHPA